LRRGPRPQPQGPRTGEPRHSAQAGTQYSPLASEHRVHTPQNQTRRVGRCLPHLYARPNAIALPTRGRVKTEFAARADSTALNTRLSVRLAVLPVADEILDHGRVGQRRGVAEIAVLVLGHLAQDPAHDLARARLRQAGRELNEIGRGDRKSTRLNSSHEWISYAV